MSLTSSVSKYLVDAAVGVVTTAAVGTVNGAAGHMILKAASKVGVPKKITKNKFVKEAAGMVAPSSAYVVQLAVGNQMTGVVVNKWFKASITASIIKLGLSSAGDIVIGLLTK